MDILSIASPIKWFGQALIVISGVSTLFWPPQVKEAGRWRVSRSVWIQVAAIIVGFLVFGVTDCQEQRRDAAQAADRDKQIAVQQEQVTGQKTLIESQNTLIENQQNEIQYLHRLILMQEELDSFQISWRPSPRLQNSIEGELRNLPQQGDDMYFPLCLTVGPVHVLGSMTGDRTFDCVLRRPQGARNVRFEYTLDAPQARAFEKVLDHLLSKSFSIRQFEGSDLVVLTASNRQTLELSISRSEIVITLHTPHVKLSRLDGAQIEFRMELTDPTAAPESLRLHSSDPNVQWNQTFQLNWQVRKYDTYWYWDGLDMATRDLYAAFSGPHELQLDFSPLLFPKSAARKPESEMRVP